MFYNIYLYLQKTGGGRPIEILMKTYRLYLEQCGSCCDDKPVLGLTRAWTLLRFIDCGIISRKACSVCSGGFVVTTEFIKTRSPVVCVALLRGHLRNRRSTSAESQAIMPRRKL